MFKSLDLLSVVALSLNAANRSPFTSRRGLNGRAYDISPPDTDISFVSSRRSVDVFPTFGDRSSFDGGPTPPRLSEFSDADQSFDSWNLGRKSVDILSPLDFASPENDKGFAPQNMVRALDFKKLYVLYI